MRNAVPMSLDHSSDSMLLTGPLAADGPEAVAVAARPGRGHVAAVAPAEHADPVGVAEPVALERGVEHGQDVVDVDAAPAGAGPPGCFGPMIAWPHAVSRPLPPRGLHISTTNPAAACIWASSKNVSPYWVNGPPWTLSRTG